MPPLKMHKNPSFLLDKRIVFFYNVKKITKEKKMTTIKVCLGSSCYIRGNDKTLAFLQDYIQKNKKDIQIELVGCRCTNLCQDGPNIFIDDKKYSKPTQDELIQILEAL